MGCGLSGSRKVGGARDHDAVCVGVICMAHPHDTVFCEIASVCALHVAGDAPAPRQPTSHTHMAIAQLGFHDGVCWLAPHC